MRIKYIIFTPARLSDSLSGPFLRENFYATEKELTERYYLGIVPHGRTHINSILEVLYQFHLEIQTLLKQALTDPDGFLDGAYLEDTIDYTRSLDSNSILTVLEQLLEYSTSLTYLLEEGWRPSESEYQEPAG